MASYIYDENGKAISGRYDLTTEERISQIEEEKKMIELKDSEGNSIYTVEDCVKPDMVNHPPHYERDGGMECIEEMEMIFGIEETMTFCKLNAWKYRYRAADKNGQEDIKKSDWYIHKYKELKDKRYPRYSAVCREHNY